MIDAWIVGIVILSAVGVIVCLAGLATYAETQSKKDIRMVGIIFAGLFVVVPIWPLVAALAIVSGIGYGVWTVARLVRHRTLDFEGIDR